ncbi:hypothetical protein PoB_003498000 [Plakobranchus ocellatus]|uniref:Uncharacterized protein n=1 Tax=Plakobranchus ocellatus TaxID=259542 RepID=A0AAV4ANL4_9GAST|nr:hypothetical protein PoB_003498000 [Plakobranchus ocellatus]
MLPSTSSKDPFSGRGTGQVDFQHTSLKRSRSRKKRRMHEMEEKQRIRGDTHWSKVLQVNPEDASWFENRRGTRMCQSFHFGHRSSFRAGRDGNKSGATCRPAPTRVTKPAPPSAKAAEPGLLATIVTRIRQWLQSKRRYEVSPGGGTDNENARKNSPRSCGGGKDATGLSISSGGPGPVNSSNGLRRESIKEDYLIISKVNDYHPELQRTEASHPHSYPMTVSKSASAISSVLLADVPTTTPFLKSYQQNYTPRKNPQNFTAKDDKPLVDINIELVEHQTSTPVELRSHFKANPLRLNQTGEGQRDAPRPGTTAMMTPATRVLSRSQQLRQSRNKYMKLLQKTGQLSPGRSPLTGTISAPAKHGLSEKGASPKIKRRQIKTWPLPCRKLMRPGM